MRDDKLAVPTTIIRAQGKWQWPDVGELWRFRELLVVLTARAIKIRYKQAVIGVGWAALQPFMTMVVFTVIFGNLAKLPSEGTPYAVFTMTALLPWQLFSRALMQGSASLVAFQGIMSRVYFPRLLAPLSEIASSLIDFAIALVIVLLLMVYYRSYPGPEVLLLPFFVLLALACSFATSIWLSAINVEYRDVQHALPFLTQIWLFITPIAYSITLVPHQWRWVYAINPMVLVVEGFRWSLLGKQWQLTVLEVGIAVGVLLAIFLGGLRYFNSVERTYVDRV
jgi:lipopolysaccharide transport system permease protein